MFAQSDTLVMNQSIEEVKKERRIIKVLQSLQQMQSSLTIIHSILSANISLTQLGIHNVSSRVDSDLPKEVSKTLAARIQTFAQQKPPSYCFRLTAA